MANPLAILGANGMLGTELAALCRQNGIAHNVYDLPAFDITDKFQLEDAVSQNDIIINCAAYTNVDKAESEPELANKINAEAVGVLGSLAAKHNKYVIHISTDFVFDGTLNRPYTETDETNPISTYGRSKLLGEHNLIGSGCQNCIIRIQWTYGRAGTNFITKLVTIAKSGKPLKVVDDQVGSPTATTEVAAAILNLLNSHFERNSVISSEARNLKPSEKRLVIPAEAGIHAKLPTGIFHFAADGYASRYEMAKFIFENLNITVNLEPCKTSDFKTAAQRPLNSRFDCSKIKKILTMPIQPWETQLKNYLGTL